MAIVLASAPGSALVVVVTPVVPAPGSAGPAESVAVQVAVQAGSLPYSLPAAGRAELGRAGLGIAVPASAVGRPGASPPAPAPCRTAGPGSPAPALPALLVLSAGQAVLHSPAPPLAHMVALRSRALPEAVLLLVASVLAVPEAVLAV